MKRLLAITLAGSLLRAAFPGAALAGDRHDASDRWAGLAIGAAAAVVGGVLLNALTPAPAPPVAYASPPVVYFPPPPVVYAPPAVVYMPPPVVYKPAPVVVHREIVVHREVAPRGRWDLGYNGPGRGWDRR
jgi:hypothetical protein